MKYLFRNLIFLFISFFCGYEAVAQQQPAFLEFLNDRWVDSTLSVLTTRQKIAQLFIVQAYSKEPAPAAELVGQVKSLNAGGVLFMQGTAANQTAITKRLQQESRIPLLVAMDAEWGPAFRLKDAPAYPVQMALGAVQDDSLIYRMGYEIGLQLKSLGVHMNFAPVADVNNNPNNPVINYRSFGESPETAARKAWLYAKGMQDAGILAVAKHFPGHGDTRTDSHHDLPVIRKDTASLNRTELYPFRKLIESGIGGIMTAHLQVPAMEPDPAVPASLSERIIRQTLIEKFGFRGLVVTDAMNMAGVTRQFGSGEAAVRALIAGNDMLEIVPDMPQAISAVSEAIREKRITEEEIDRKCRKVLALKRWLNIPAEGVNSGGENLLHKPEYELTRRLLHEKSITVLRNHNDLLPLQKLDTLKLAVVAIGTTVPTPFQKMLARYLNADFFFLRENASAQETDQLVRSLQSYNLLIGGIHNLNLTPTRNYGTDPSIESFIRKTAHMKRIMALFGNPYALNYLSGIDACDGLLVTYQENVITQELAAQAIFGAIAAEGKLPVNVSVLFRLHDGISLKKNSRLKYSVPEEAGISSAFLQHRIDSIVNAGLSRKAYPGCQVLVAKDGCIIFLKNYGYLTYEKDEPVEEETLYDLASLTKITGTTPALMKLYGENKLSLNSPFSNYWPAFKGTDKQRITLRQMLAHQSRLRPGISFWSEAEKAAAQPGISIFQDRPSPQFDVRVSSLLYMDHDYIGKMYDQIRDSRLLPQIRYSYSDLPFYLFPKVVESLTGVSFEDYLQKNFFRPLGAATLMFNPYRYFPPGQIAPTENDDFFRNEIIRGFVHDEGAAMLGGISGNAGLFSNANDLAKMMQMILQKGSYGGETYLDPEVVEQFTKVQFPENQNRRGLGFDKPYINNYLYRQHNAYPAPDASPESFGHGGFTGTFAWMDPRDRTVFIFLTNRIYPTRKNSLLSQMNIRSSILQTIYEAVHRGLDNH